MIPSALVGQLEQGLGDFLRASFSSTTPGFRGAIDRLLGEPGGVAKGPYVQVFLPFVKGSKPNFFPKVPLGFTPHLHQERAFERLGGEQKKSTLVATGTGSGKTESFLWPILSHCLEHAGTPGIKAILVYPMNALASDQALRIARVINGNPLLKGAVTAGLYVGDDEGGRAAQAEMGPEHIISDRAVLQKSPPDILLTNYKMLDYLLLRPKDRHLWASSTSGSLRYLVVDELHTFDGAQGTDLACLIRRLKDRLHVRPGQLCCVGTSATLGGDSAGVALRGYAEKVFAETFDEGAVVGESRVSLETFRGDTVIRFFDSPGLTDLETMDPSRYTDVTTFAAAQARLWFDEAIPGEPGTDAWRVTLGAMLREHVMLDNLLRRLRGSPRGLDDLADELANAAPAFRSNAELGRRALLSLLALVSEARQYREELADARERREAEGRQRSTEPFLNVRIQLWQRELRRMVASVGDEPRLTFWDDLTKDQRKVHLPVIHCRECGAMGWSTLVAKQQPHVFQVDVSAFYKAFFAGDSRIRFVFPSTGLDEGSGVAQLGLPLRLHTDTLTARNKDDEPLKGGEIEVRVCHQTREDRRGRVWLSRDCPFCHHDDSLSLLGFQAATLTSVYIDQLYSSPFNDDKKLLTFSDSVQDAAHRAGFFAARTWRFNVRVALQRFIEAEGDGLTLAQLPERFVAWWRGTGGMSEVQFICTFLAPNMTWMQDYEGMLSSGNPPTSPKLLDDIRRRLAWELNAEFGLQARIGRSLPRTRCAVAAIDDAHLERVLPGLLEVLRNEVGGLRALTPEQLKIFLLGFLQHRLERGGVLHDELPREFVRTGESFHFSRMYHLPDYGPRSRLPELLVDRTTPRFDNLSSGSRTQPSASERWFAKTLASTSTLVAEAAFALPLVVRALVKAGIFEERELANGGTAWGISPAALRVATEVAVARCERCGHGTTVSAGHGASWVDAPCVSGHCPGRCIVEAGTPDDYFGRLYRRGDVERIFAEEHTGLLKRKEREKIEDEFKASAAARKPWFPNLLSCTPTLEMGIDIGDLSTAALCSVPPAQANYLQRIGRAGRRDGNALVLTIANARNHDLYFYAAPEEMIAGQIDPPGVYLDASSVLERQLTAFCFDRWAVSGVDDDALPASVRDVYLRLASDNPAHFPHSFRKYVEDHQAELVTDFVGLFPIGLHEETRAHLATFMKGVDQEAGLTWRILAALHAEKKLIENLRERRKQATALLLKKKKQPTDDTVEREIAELEQERSALSALIESLDGRDTLNFFTDEGLLPNYAFPEAAVALRSVIWRKRRAPVPGKSPYESWTYEYARPSAAAIGELAPENTFYAGGRAVQIDQVDVQSAELERWRFCDECSFSERVGEQPVQAECPSCASKVWPDPGREHSLLRLRQVFANTEDRKSRLKDDRDDRSPRFYSRQTLMSFRDEDRGKAWAVESKEVPFAWEGLMRAKFREINFGEVSEEGTSISIAGRDAVRAGFKICRQCGKLQKDPTEATHAIACAARGTPQADTVIDTVWLYREFSSEAIRMLLPIADFASERQLHSFLAALQVGLREYFGGRVDHLHVMLDSEPVPGTSMRKQFVVLFDSVPGGTGYLKELVREPEHLMKVFSLAQDRLTRCVCAADPQRDGCYRCVLAYRRSSDMPDISRSAAITLLSRILEFKDAVKSITSVSEVSVKGMLDSILEARFLEALRRLGSKLRPSVVSKAIVKGKPGYHWTIGERSWLIEPQVDLGPQGGLGVGVSIDFVFHPVGAPGAQAVAVFTDGWEFHKDRVAFDLLQRMALRASGKYDPWSFTWSDVERVLGQGHDAPPLNLAIQKPEKLQMAGPSGPLIPGQLRARLENHNLEWFAATLAGEVSAVDWIKLSYLALFTHLEPLSTEAKAEWQETLSTTAPPEAAEWLSFAMTPGALGYSVAATPDTKWSFHVVVQPDALQKDFQGLGSGDVSGLRLLSCLHDTEETDDGDMRRTWDGALRTMNFLRLIPRGWFVAMRHQSSQKYSILASLSESPGSTGASPWSAVEKDVQPKWKAVVGVLAAMGIAAPLVGEEVPDARDRPACNAELLWPDVRVAVVEAHDLADAKLAVALGWRLFSLPEVEADPSVLAAALLVGSAEGGDQ